MVKVNKTLFCGMAFFIALSLTAPVSVFAQAVYGSISGTVTDPSGSAIPNAKVTITDIGKGVSFSTTSNASGNYAQTHLIVGVYEVRVEATGFQAYLQKSVHV